MEGHLISFIPGQDQNIHRNRNCRFPISSAWHLATMYSFVTIYSPHGHVPLDSFIYSPELRLNFSQEINSLSWILGLLYLISRKLYSLWVKKMSMIWLHWLQITEGLVSGKQRFPLCFSILTEDEVFWFAKWSRKCGVFCVEDSSVAILPEGIR